LACAWPHCAAKHFFALNTHQSFIAVIVLQQGVFALIWLLLARMRMARGLALHWAAATSLFALAMTLVLLRDQLSHFVGTFWPNVVNVAAFLLAWRGVCLFLHQKPRDTESALVLGASSVGVLAVLWLGLGRNWVVVFAATGMAWPALRAATQAHKGLRAELGAWAAPLCAAPLWLVGGILLTRSAAAALDLARGVPESQSLAGGGSLQLGIVFVFLAMGLALNFGLGAMVILRLVNKLRHLSLHDALTGLVNRRGLGQRLGDERQRLQRHGTPFALLSLDIDHFKQVNDKHGHAVGDGVLVGVAQLLKREARALDVVARTGGEEFCLLLPATDQAGAMQLAQRLLQAHRSQAHEAAGQRLKVTVSIGLALADSRRETDVELWRRVDAALYRAKGNGRDRIEVAEAASST
jgi:diguanylate cyclase (GGDEF)-like protein